MSQPAPPKPPLRAPVLFFFFFLLFPVLFLPTSTAKTSAATKPNATAVPPSPSPASTPAPPKANRSRSPSTHSTLDPKQLTALRSLEISTAKDPCTQPSPRNATVCDSATPFRHLISLQLSNCSSELSISYTALKSLSTLRSLTFTNCPVNTVRFPSDLALSLRSFTCIHSLKHLSGVWLSHFMNLTDLTVTDAPVTASGLYVFLGNMHSLKSVTISNANVSGYITRHLHINLTHVDFSGNNLTGTIPGSISVLENLETLDLSSNSLTGEVPAHFGDLISLKSVSLRSNSFSGSIPSSMSAIPGLVHVDLSSNKFNGTIPGFFARMKRLRYLNLENNAFHGVLPFNLTFIKRLTVFKVGGNSNLCYNHTTLSSKLKLGIAPCDKHGLPLSPPPSKEASSDGGSESYSSDDDSDSSSKKDHHHGPNKVVLGFAIALSSIVFLIVFLVFLSKRCR